MQFHVWTKGNVAGPFTPHRIAKLVSAKIISRKDLCAAEGSDVWHTVEEMKGYIPLVASNKLPCRAVCTFFVLVSLTAAVITHFWTEHTYVNHIGTLYVGDQLSKSFIVAKIDSQLTFTGESRPRVLVMVADENEDVVNYLWIPLETAEIMQAKYKARKIEH